MKQRHFRSALAACAFSTLLSACSETPSPIPPPSPEALADCNQSRDLDRAIAGCSAAIEAGSKDAQLRVNRGFSYFRKADYDRSLADYNEAIRLNPKEPAAFQRRGLTFRARGEDDRAIADFTQAINLGSTDLNVFIDRGMAHFTKGENAQAIADYTTAIERDADKTFVGQLAHVVRGLAFLYSGAPDKAQADLRRAVELNPKEPFFALFLHLAERRMGSAGSLAAATPNLDMTKWPAPVIRMFLGEGTPEAVLAVKGGEVTVCEVDYFVAEFMLLEGKKEEALRLYTKAQTDCPRYILEGVASRAALRSLGVTP
jgi:tetratricopeptide (TPR) repeat protein